MDQDSTHMVAASKVPMLKPGVETKIAPTTAEEKAQRRLLRRASSSEVLDQTFDRLQKLISQLEIHGESISQEDVNQKFLRSLSPEWNTHTIITNNTNGAVNTTLGATTASTQATAVNSTTIDNLSDAVIYAFFASLPNSPQLDNEDLQQIHPNDLEEMDLRWQMAMLTMRARRFLKNTRRKFSVNDNEEDDVPQAKIEKKIFKPSFVKIEFVKPKQQEKTARKTVNHVDCKKVNQKQFQNTKPIWNNAKRVNHHNFAKKTHPYPKKNIVPGAVLMKSGQVSLNIASQVNTAHPKITMNSARLMTNLSKSAHSTPRAVVNAARPNAVVNAVKGNNVNAVKASACWVWKPKTKVLDHVSKHNSASITLKKFDYVDAQGRSNYEEIDGGYVAFGGNPKGGKITGRGTIKTGNLDFENVYFVKELKFNLFSVLQMCDKKNNVLFNDTECIVLSPNFKLTDESQVLLKVPRKNNMYSVDLKNIVPKGGLTCLFAKATSDESELWHRRLGHINFKTMNKLVKRNLVRDNYSRFSWVFFLATKDETSSILKSFITGVENLIDQKVKVIRCDNGTKFKNKEMNQFCKRKGKFDGKADEGLFVGYSIYSKAFRVFNCRTRIVEENLHVQFSENTPNIAGSGPNWLFDIDALTKSMNYKPVVAGNQSNGNAGTKACDDAGKARMETVPGKDYILLPLWTADLPFSQSSKSSPDAGFKPSGDDEKKVTEEPGKEGGDPSKEGESNDQEKEDNVNSTNTVNAASTNEVNVVGAKTCIELLNDPNMPELEDIVYSDDDEDVGAKADMNNLDAFMPVSPIPTTRIHKDHPVEQIIRDFNSAPQTRRMTKNLEEYGLFSSVQQRTNHKDIQNYLFACFLSQEEPKKVIHALKDPSWIEAMQEELLQFKLQEVWTLLDLPNRKKAIGTKWVFRNKKDERGIIDVKSAFLYGKIEKEVYVCQPPGFEDPDFPDRVYKVEKALYGLHQAPKACKAEGRWDFISQDKYVTEILKKFGFTDVKTASTLWKLKSFCSRMKMVKKCVCLCKIPSQPKGFTSSCCKKDL
ncbi:ribonuclease H-like domain-containing protein [Tanacetum coccineum]